MIRQLAGVGVALALCAVPVKAATLDFGNQCDPVQLNVCMHVTVTDMGGGSYSLTVENTGTAGNLAAIGLFPVGGAGWSVDLGSVSGLPSGWDSCQGQGSGQCSGLGGYAIGIGANTTNGNNDAITPGNSITFNFSVTGGELTMSNTADIWHAIGLQQSVKCSSDPTDDHFCDGTVTPEPITVTMLATGLLGLGGVGLRRRRKGFDVVNE